MSFTYDLTTDVGKLRLLIADTDETDADFTDEELAVFLDMEGNSANMAAARAFETLAGDKARLASSYRTGNVSEDLTAVAGELRKQAQALRANADADALLEVVISPSWERFTYEQNTALDRDGTTRSNP